MPTPTMHQAGTCTPPRGTSPTNQPRALDQLAEECKALECPQADGDWPVTVSDVIVERVGTLVDLAVRRKSESSRSGGSRSRDSSPSDAPSPTSSLLQVAEDDAAVVKRYFSDTKIFGTQLTRRYAAPKPF